MLDALVKLSQEFLLTKNQKFRRYFISQVQLDERLSILKGQRGIGKTTLIIQYLLDFVGGDRFSPKILYIQADHLSLGSLTLYAIAEHFYLNGGEFIAFDEIHKYPAWSIELKSIYDSFPRLKVLASGSSALAIHKGSHDLSRRAIVYHLCGLSFREYLTLFLNVKLASYPLEEILNRHQNICDEILSALRIGNYKVIPCFKEYLKIGYFPYFYELNNEMKFKMTLEQNVHTTLESDLPAIYPQLTANSIRKVKQLLTYVAQSVPFVPKWQQLKEILEIGDERTLKTYFNYLEDAELICAINTSSQKLHALEHHGKIYLSNTNLAYALALDQTNIGTMREIFFYNMLSQDHRLSIPLNGDFLVNNKFLFEVGGQSKGLKQIKASNRANFIAADGIEMGVANKIPVWLFGFLY